jgi:hypothetical protein
MLVYFLLTWRLFYYLSFPSRHVAFVPRLVVAGLLAVPRAVLLVRRLAPVPRYTPLIHGYNYQEMPFVIAQSSKELSLVLLGFVPRDNHHVNLAGLNLGFEPPTPSGR